MKRNLISFLICVLAPGWLSSQPPGWHPLGEMPWRVAAAGAVSTDSLVIILGGFSDSLFASVPWIQTYRPSTGTWERVGSMMKGRRDFAAASWGDSLYYCGGNSPGDSSVEVYPLSLPPQSAPFATSRKLARLAPAGAAAGGIFYVFGGQYFGGPSVRLPYIVGLDLAARAITYQNDSLFRHGSQGVGQMAALLDNTIYLFGGVFNTVSRDIYRFDIHTRQFTKLPVLLLQPRAFGRAVRLGNSPRIMILGGRNETSAAMGTTEIFEVRPPPGGYTLMPGPPMMVPRSRLMAVEHGGSVYAFGGFDQSQNVVRVVERHTFLTAVGDRGEEREPVFRILGNYPNPFNPMTNLEFRLSEPGSVSLRVYNLLGEEVALLASGRFGRGTHTVQWDGTNHPAGVYLVRLQSGRSAETRKMMLLR
ncbi:MAG: kelch repeat-containing protein [Bacteroidota bacterium]